jgi:predicted nucleotide-binding protein
LKSTVGGTRYSRDQWIEWEGKQVTTARTEVDPRKVFVIHGRNEPARKGLFTFLRAIGLEPIEWSQAIAMTRQGSPYIGDVLNVAFGAAQAVVVLQTPDDVAHLHESLTYPGDPETSPQLQPRPNVLFEAGMALARDENRTIIVELGQIKSFSDIHGRHVVRLDNSTTKRQDLAHRLRTAGCAVNLEGTDWHQEGDLTPPATPGGGLPLGRKLPSSRASGEPRLEITLRKTSKSNELMTITNHGPGEVYDLDFSLPDDREGTSEWREEGFPVPKLPPGKSVNAARYLRLASRSPAYFTVLLTGKTADGVEIRQEEFVSGQ